MKRYRWLIGAALLLAGIGLGFLLGRQQSAAPAAPQNVEAQAAPEAGADAADGASQMPAATPDPWVATVVEPSCEAAGFTRYENRQDGTVRIEDGAPATGHSYGDWQTDPDTGVSTRVCAVCGAFQTRQPVEASLPRVELSGDMAGIGKAERVLLGLSYQDGDESFSCYALTSWQGHSSLVNEKKNYTIRLFEDDALTDKHRAVLRPGWQLEHKYILKANYWDISQCRNLIGADVWAAMAAARENLPQRLSRTSHYGAVDGFPVTVWLNGEFHGLYTLNLHKDDDLYDMRGGERDAVLICNAQTMDEALFRADAAFEPDVSDWEVEYCGTEDDEWARDKFNALSRFLREADDGALRSGLSEYLDLEAAEDYLLFIWAMGLRNSGAKDLVLLCYDDGVWIPSVYDMEEAFGLNADGSGALGAAEWLPGRGEDGAWTSGTGSLLFDRLVRAFAPELKARWQALRRGPLSDAAMDSAARARLDAVPDELIQADLQTYPNREALSDPKGQIIDYICERLTILDTTLGGLEG